MVKQFILLKMEAQFFSETFVTIYQSTLQLNLHQHDCKNVNYLFPCLLHLILLVINLSSIFFCVFVVSFVSLPPSTKHTHTVSLQYLTTPIFTVIIHLCISWPMLCHVVSVICECEVIICITSLREYRTRISFCFLSEK